MDSTEKTLDVLDGRTMDSLEVSPDEEPATDTLLNTVLGSGDDEAESDASVIRRILDGLESVLSGLENRGAFPEIGYAVG